MDVTIIEQINALITVLKLFLVLCAGIATVGGAAVVVNRWKNKVKEPEVKQDEAISLLQETLDEEKKRNRELFDRDNKRLRVLEDGMSTSIHAQLALLSHAIEGDNEQEMKDARKMINKYLIDK